jgi:nucleoside-diphosphate-sugar epimerase
MKALFIGGTGNISTACTRLALGKNIEVFHLNRGNRAGRTPEGTVTLTADARDPAAITKAIRGLHFDCVVQWVAYLPEQVEADIEVFKDSTNQYVFISSASAYSKPLPHPVISESFPVGNPLWPYSDRKAMCERTLAATGTAKGLPWTIVRPAHTYDDGFIPTNFGSRDYTIANRILEGKEIIVHGDGETLWTLTHSSDFARGLVGLIGNPAALGQAFHITSDEFLTWHTIFRTLGRALGREPLMVHIPADYIAAMNPELGAPFLGERAHSHIFDNSKIKRLVPGFKTEVSFAEGIRRSLAWFDAHPEAKVIEHRTEGEMERILAAWNEHFPRPA